MCVYSVVHDHYSPRFPDPCRPLPWVPRVPDPARRPAIDWSKLFKKKPDVEVEALKVELRKLIDEYREALAAAKKVDALTGQPDCPRPEKRDLEKRVDELERRFLKPKKGKSKSKRGAKKKAD